MHFASISIPRDHYQRVRREHKQQLGKIDLVIERVRASKQCTFDSIFCNYFFVISVITEYTLRYFLLLVPFAWVHAAI
jgi:hypothetical protein